MCLHKVVQTAKKKRRGSTKQFKADAVRLAKENGKSSFQKVKDLDLNAFGNGFVENTRDVIKHALRLNALLLLLVWLMFLNSAS